MTNSSPDFELYLVRNFFDAATCRELIAEMRMSPVRPGVTYGQGNGGHVNEWMRKVTRAQSSPETVSRVVRRLMDHRRSITGHFGIKLNNCEKPQFLCYRTGDFFVAHQDGNTGLIRLETDESRRISVVIFLNQQSQVPEVDSYGGGSLVFSDWRSNRKLSFVGEAGTLVAFRSETTHEVIPVTHGERFSIVSWYR